MVLGKPRPCGRGRSFPGRIATLWADFAFHGKDGAIGIHLLISEILENPGKPSRPARSKQPAMNGNRWKLLLLPDG
jgi:hypothetical protein